MKQEAGYFEGHDPELIYIARKLKDATRLEALLDAAGIEYGVEPDYYVAGVVFRTSRVGAFFYVLSEWRERAIQVLIDNGLNPAP